MESTATLSVVIPVYNEAETVITVLERVTALPFIHEVVVVDDGSTDGTREVLAGWDPPTRPAVRVILQERNGGKGAALRAGFAKATGDILAVQDADLEVKPLELEPLYRLVASGRTDVAFGSRFLRSRKRPWTLSLLANKVLTLMTNFVIGQRITDMETCCKMFRREALDRISLRSDRFGFEPEVTIKLARRGYRILERPIGYVPRTKGKKINWKDGLGAIWHILVFRFWDPVQ